MAECSRSQLRGECKNLLFLFSSVENFGFVGACGKSRKQHIMKDLCTQYLCGVLVFQKRDMKLLIRKMWYNRRNNQHLLFL